MSNLTKTDLAQLQETLTQAENGVWACVQTEDSFGIACGAVAIADNMTLSNAYLVDVMHAHFRPMLEQLNSQADTIARLQDELTKLTLDFEIKTTENTNLKHAYQAGVTAFRLLQNDYEKLQELNKALDEVLSSLRSSKPEEPPH